MHMDVKILHQAKGCNMGREKKLWAHTDCQLPKHSEIKQDKNLGKKEKKPNKGSYGTLLLYPLKKQQNQRPVWHSEALKLKNSANIAL